MSTNNEGLADSEPSGQKKRAASVSRAKKPAVKTTKPTPKPTAKSAPKSAAKTTTKAPVAEPLVVLKGVTKNYGEIIAADAVDLEVPKGEIFALLGSNGAGKTTLISIMSGLLKPDEGSVTISDVDIWKNPKELKKLGVLPDRMRFFDRLTAWQYLYYVGALKGIPRVQVRERSVELMQKINLEQVGSKPLNMFSTGMKRKVAFISTMLGSPKFLILDEAFEGIDPVSVAELVELLKTFTLAGGSVLISSHDIELIQKVATSVAIVDRGKILASGSMATIRAGKSLRHKYLELLGIEDTEEDLEWLRPAST